MPRIRTIKPEFWASEQVVECSPTARLLFVGLWNFCDDAGRHPVSFKRIKMEVFPGDDFSCDEVCAWLNELLAVGLLCAYSTEDQTYLAVTGWDRHQKIDKPSVRFPGPFDEGSATVRRLVGDHSTTIRRAVTRGEGEGEGDLNRFAAQTSVGLKPDRSVEVRQVFNHYRTYHPRSHPKPSSASKEWRAAKARLAEGYTAADLIEAIDGAHRTPHNLGANDRGQKYLGLELILRTGDQVARFIENARNPPAPKDDRERRALDAIDEWLSRRKPDNAAE